MQNWKATLTYDGTPFHGWQVQPDLPSIQGTLAQAIHRITGETILPQGSGRTDAGVHALGQVASFALHSPIPRLNLHRALNRALPPSVRILSLDPMPPAFHARHCALRKTYEYRILPTGPTHICSPMLAPFVWDLPSSLDLGRLQQATAHILGTHDFTSFAASRPDLTTRIAFLMPPQQPDAFPGLAVNERPDIHSASASASEAPIPPAQQTDSQSDTSASNIRTIFDAHWTLTRTGFPVESPSLRDHPEADSLFTCRITGSGFLHHMVRNLVGTFVEASLGRIEPDNLPAILAARDRSAAGPTAPARGLFLVSVVYPEAQSTSQFDLQPISEPV